MKKLEVSVKPNSRVEKVTAISEKNFEVKVSAPPEDGKANKRTIELLAKHLGVAKSNLCIIQGHKSKKKLIQWDDK